MTTATDRHPRLEAACAEVFPDADANGLTVGRNDWLGYDYFGDTDTNSVRVCAEETDPAGRITVHAFAPQQILMWTVHLDGAPESVVVATIYAALDDAGLVPADVLAEVRVEEAAAERALDDEDEAAWERHTEASNR